MLLYFRIYLYVTEVISFAILDASSILCACFDFGKVSKELEKGEEGRVHLCFDREAQCSGGVKINDCCQATFRKKNH